MRDLNHFVLGKGFLPSVKGHLSFTLRIFEKFNLN